MALAVTGCASVHEAPACRDVSNSVVLKSTPHNVELLYSLTPDFRRPRPEQHEHWYQVDQDTLVVCRHAKTMKGSCGSERAAFGRTPEGWKLAEPIELIICAS